MNFDELISAYYKYTINFNSNVVIEINKFTLNMTNNHTKRILNQKDVTKCYWCIPVFINEKAIDGKFDFYECNKCIKSVQLF